MLRSGNYCEPQRPQRPQNAIFYSTTDLNRCSSRKLSRMKCGTPAATLQRNHQKNTRSFLWSLWSLW